MGKELLEMDQQSPAESAAQIRSDTECLEMRLSRGFSYYNDKVYLPVGMSG